MREQDVECYEGKSPSDMIEILKNHLKGGGRIVSVVRAYSSGVGNPKSSYIVVYEKPYDD